MDTDGPAWDWPPVSFRVADPAAPREITGPAGSTAATPPWTVAPPPVHRKCGYRLGSIGHRTICGEG
jgi:hypothetical protein